MIRPYKISLGSKTTHIFHNSRPRYSSSAISTGDGRVEVNLSFILGAMWDTDGKDWTEMRESEPQT